MTRLQVDHADVWSWYIVLCCDQLSIHIHICFPTSCPFWIKERRRSKESFRTLARWYELVSLTLQSHALSSFSFFSPITASYCLHLQPPFSHTDDLRAPVGVASGRVTVYTCSNTFQTISQRGVSALMVVNTCIQQCSPPFACVPSGRKHISKPKTDNRRRRGTGEERSARVQGEAKWMKREETSSNICNVKSSLICTV